MQRLWGVLFCLLLLQGCATQRLDPLPRSWEEQNLVFEEELPLLQQQPFALKYHILSARPNTTDTYPVILLTHGSSSSKQKDLLFRKTYYDIIKYKYLLRHFAEQGYAAVFFAHKGHSRTQGSAAPFSCSQNNFGAVARSVGEDFKAVHAYLGTKDWADAERTFIGGQSTGGVGALSYATANPKGVIGVINFAGTYACTRSRRMTKNIWNADPGWTMMMGLKNDIPQLWIYGDQDHLTNIPDVLEYVDYPRIKVITLVGIGHGVMREKTLKHSSSWAYDVKAFMKKASDKQQMAAQ